MNDENIFIYDLRRNLPQLIKKSVFDKKLDDSLNEKEKVLFHRNYYMNYLDYLGDEYYVLKSVFPVINRSIIENDNVNGDEITVIKNIYKLDEENGIYVLKETVSEVEEIVILNLLNKRNNFIPGEEKRLLSDIFEKFDFIEKEDVFYASVNIDPNHNYFFEHPLDHVPGMMLLESARQFIVACAHVFGKVPLGNSQIILSKLEASFDDFVEIQYPITVMGKMIEKKNTESGVWTYIDTDFFIFQNNRAVGKFKLTGSNVSLKVFKKIRERKINAIKTSRFIPYPTIKYKFFFKNIMTGSYQNVKLINISNEGLMVEAENSCQPFDDSLFDFFLVFEGHDLVHGKCELVWQKEMDGCNKAGFKISSLSENDEMNMKKIIIRCCHVVEDRYFF